MVIIREAVKSDLVGLSMLFEELMNTKSNIDKMTKTFRYIQNDESYKLLVAEQGGKLVGSVMGILCYDLVEECKPFMVLENIVVAREARGQGIGAKLMRKLEEVAKKSEAKYTMFVPSSSREEAQKFYEEVGYKKNMVDGFKKFL